MRLSALKLTQLLIGVGYSLAILVLSGLSFALASVFTSDWYAKVCLAVVLVALGVIGYRRFVVLYEKRVPTELHLHELSARTGITLAVLVALQFAAMLTALFISGFDIELSWQNITNVPKDEIGLLFIAFVSAIFVAPVVEEIFFRGVVFRFLISYVPLIIALTVQSLIFALLHSLTIGDLSFYRVVQLILNGVCFALLFVHSGSLIIPMMVHAGWNAVSISTLLFLPSNVLLGGQDGDLAMPAITTTILVIECFAVLLICVVLWFFGDKIFVQSRDSAR